MGQQVVFLSTERDWRWGGGYRRGKKVLEGADRIRYTLQGVGVNRWERNVCVERCLGIKHMLYVVCIFVNHISE